MAPDWRAFSYVLALPVRHTSVAVLVGWLVPLLKLQTDAIAEASGVGAQPRARAGHPARARGSPAHCSCIGVYFDHGRAAPRRVSGGCFSSAESGTQILKTAAQESGRHSYGHFICCCRTSPALVVLAMSPTVGFRTIAAMRRGRDDAIDTEQTISQYPVGTSKTLSGLAATSDNYDRSLQMLVQLRNLVPRYLPRATARVKNMRGGKSGNGESEDGDTA
jgi:hypothetical protein